MHNFKNILDENIITDLTNDPKMQNTFVDREKTVIQALYEEQYNLLREKKYDLVDDGKAIQSFSANNTLNPRETIVDGVNPNVFKKKAEIDRENLDSEIAEIHRQRKEVEQMRADIEDILAKTKEESEAVMEHARTESERMRKEALESGHKKGYEQGHQEGYDEGYTKARAKMVKEQEELVEKGTVAFFRELEVVLSDIANTKDDLIKDNIKQMKEISLSVAEKIVTVSLQSSGEVIRKMIVNATDKILDKAWAKIYISKFDSAMLLQINVDLLKELSHISPHLQIETIDNAPQGTCIIELPDQMIDASINTQFDKIKDVIDNCDYGGNGGIQQE